MNQYGFTPAPRTPNMIWQSDLDGDPPVDDTHSDFAFTGNIAIQAEYNNFRLIDISNPDEPRRPSATKPCPGSQGDVVVFGDIVVRGHEGTHNIPNGDLSRACETGGGEIQTVALTGFDTNGDSFRLTRDGAYIGADRARHELHDRRDPAGDPGPERDSAGRHDRLQRHHGLVPGPRQRGPRLRAPRCRAAWPISNANVALAINSIPGFAGTVTVAGAGNGGFTVDLRRPSAATDVPRSRS